MQAQRPPVDVCDFHSAAPQYSLEQIGPLPAEEMTAIAQLLKHGQQICCACSCGFRSNTSIDVFPHHTKARFNELTAIDHPAAGKRRALGRARMLQIRLRLNVSQRYPQVCSEGEDHHAVPATTRLILRLPSSGASSSAPLDGGGRCHPKSRPRYSYRARLCGA